MYNIQQPSPLSLLKHADDLIPLLKAKIEEFMPTKGKQCVEVKNTKKLKINAVVKKNSITDWFLWKIHDETYLRKLLVGDMNYLLSVIKEVECERAKRNIDPDLIYSKMTKELYVRLNGKHNNKSRKVTRQIDSFNEIISAIFVDYGYKDYKDSKNKILVFNKVQHVNSLNLRICPYCGRSYIFHITHNDKYVKPQLEHFLPKSQYPFLALSYFNLIPVCNVCNVDCKGTFNPLVSQCSKSFKIIYPYEFDDNMLTFMYKLNNGDYYKDSSFEILIDYGKQKELEDGSRNVMKLDSFYACHNHEAANIYRKLLLLKSHAQCHYRYLGLTETFTTITPMHILGFRFDVKTSRQELLYKFKKDIYLQMTKNL